MGGIELISVEDCGNRMPFRWRDKQSNNNKQFHSVKRCYKEHYYKYNKIKGRVLFQTELASWKHI